MAILQDETPEPTKGCEHAMTQPTYEDIPRLRNAQFRHTARILNDAAEYYSDSVLDDCTSALDAADFLNHIDTPDQLTDWICNNDPDHQDRLGAYLLDGIAPQLIDFALQL